VVAAATLGEIRQGALVVIGADEELARAMERAGARRMILDPCNFDEVRAVLVAAGALWGTPTVELVLRLSGGWPGRVARLARELADRPGATRDELCRVIEPPATPSVRPKNVDDAMKVATAAFEAGTTGLVVDMLSGFNEPRARHLLARAEARRGNLEQATALIEGCLPIEDPALHVEAASWFERCGKYDAAWELIEGPAKASDSAGALVLAARAAIGRGDLSAAQELARRGLSLKDVDAATECRGRCVLSDAARLLGDVAEAAREGEGAERAARTQQDPTLFPQAIARQAAAAALAGESNKARELYTRALEEALSAGDVVGIPPYVVNLATAEHALGEYGAALARYQEAARIAGRLDRRVVETAALVNWAGLLVDLGAVDEARPILDKAFESAAKAEAPFFAAQACLVRASLLGSTNAKQGYAEALGAADDFLAAEADEKVLEAHLLASELAVEAGDWAVAGERYADCMEAQDAGRVALLAARIALGAGDLQGALREAERCIELAAVSLNRDLEGRALRLAAHVHDRLGTGATEPLVARAKETFGRVSARLPPGLREKYLNSPQRHLDGAHGATRVTSTGGDALRLWALVRRLLLEGSETRLLEAAVDEALGLTGAERAFLLTRKGASSPSVAVARNMASMGAAAGDRGARFSRSVAERVIESGELIATTNASADSSLRGAESIHFLGLRSILCVPIRGPQGVAGALYLDHRLERARFGEGQSELVQALADIIGVALENARLHRQARKNAQALARANEALRRENEQRSAEIERLGHLLELRGEQVSLEAPGGIVGRSRLLRHSLEVARRTAPSGLSVLVEGASGTGKELVARFLHEQSHRSGPFVAVNCGALPATLLDSELFGHVRGAFTGADRDHPGLFRAAEGGTLMLDEIGEMPLQVQPHLLRVLQEREVQPLGQSGAVPVDVRVVAATNKDLEREVRQGRFRQDLYYRLAAVRIGIPSLLERREDIPLLAAVFLKQAAEALGRSPVDLSRGALKRLLQHDWPGNVRELQQTIQRAVVLAEGPQIEATDLGLQSSPVVASRDPRSFDAEAVRQAIRDASGNRKKAAERLGVSRSTLYRWLERYDID
jgi:transcriptional regulator with GAF, ATPase, and Fis domain/tetratricopeptide (TPR) repeat protein